MQKLGLLLMIVILGTTVSMAQNRGGQNLSPEERAKQTTEELKEVLDLKKDQEKPVYDISLKAGKEMAQMRKEMQDGGDRDAMREKFGKMRDKTNKEMEKVLTADQYKKYLKHLEEQRAKRGQGGGGNR